MERPQSGPFESLIQRAQLGRPFKFLLDLIGPRELPPMVDMERVRMNVDLLQAGFNGSVWVGCAGEIPAPLGISATKTIAGPGVIGVPTTFPTQIPTFRRELNDDPSLGLSDNGVQRHYTTRILALSIELDLGAGFAAVAPGSDFDFFLRLEAVGPFIGSAVAVDVFRGEELFDSDPAKRDYRWCLNGWTGDDAQGDGGNCNWGGIIPPRFDLIMGIEQDEGVAFPVDAVLRYNVLGVQIPEGGQLLI